MTDATHIQIEEAHVVMFNDLRVLISGDDQSGWFAQGIEIDYYACGDTLEAVQSNFANGFQLTLEDHLSRYGDIERFLRWAPFDEIMKLMDSTKYNFSNINKFHIKKEKDVFFPFDNLCFITQELRHAA